MERFAQSKVVLGGICSVLVTVLSLQAGPSAARGAGQTATPQRNPPAAPFDRSLLDSYCVGCHNARTKMAGLAFDQLDPTRVGDNAQVWEKVVGKQPSIDGTLGGAMSFSSMLTHALRNYGASLLLATRPL